MNNEWIRVPKYNPPEIDYKDVDKKFQGLVSEIHEMENLMGTADFSSISKEELYSYAEKLKKNPINELFTEAKSATNSKTNRTNRVSSGSFQEFTKE